MGKTLPPFSQLMDAERRRWAPFTRALLQADQAAFDRLFDCAKLHIQAGVMVSRPWPLETVVMAVLLEQEKRITQLLDALQALNTAHTAAAGSGRRPEDSAVSTHGRMQA